MALFSKAKRATQPLDDRVRASLCGRTTSDPSSTSSSSSSSVEDDQCSLADLVLGFLEEADSTDPPATDAEDEPGDSSCANDDCNDPATALLSVLYQDLNTDQFRIQLHSDVLWAVERLPELRPDLTSFRSALAAVLREYGYDAGVCRTRWTSSGGVNAGSYEFVDVVRSGKPEERYIVDPELRPGFEIARPTEEYRRVMVSLPVVFVGKAEELKLVVIFVSGAAKRSMKEMGLHLPPWRKSRYMQNKWLGPYSRRALNSVQPGSTELNRHSVVCRFVGSQAGLVLGDRRFVV